MKKRKGYLIFWGVIPVLFFLVNRIASANTPPSPSFENGESLGLDTIIYSPIVFNNFDSNLGTPPTGVQMYGNTGETSPYYSSLIQSGVSWVRVNASWSSVEPERTLPPTYIWGSVDNTLALARPDLGGLNMIATIRNMPDWAAPGLDEKIYPDRLDEFAEFVSALVERFDGDGIEDAPGSPVVLYWEFFNEPDRFNWWGQSGAEYADLLKVVYPVLKEANPKAQLVFAGIAYDWFEDQNGPFTRSFLTDVLDNGGGNYFDVMNFHSYPVFFPNWTTNMGPGLLEKGQEIQNILSSYNLTKPIVVTETGWHSNDVPAAIPGSPEIQAKYVIQLMTQGYALHAKFVIWWMFYDIGGTYPYDNGLVTNSNPPMEKLAYFVFEDLVDTLGTAHFVRKFSQAETGTIELEAYEFNDNVKNRQLFVAWLNPVTATNIKPLRIPVTRATVRDPIAGTQSSVLDGHDGIIDGNITVQVGANPLYVEVDK